MLKEKVSSTGGADLMILEVGMGVNYKFVLF